MLGRSMAGAPQRGTPPGADLFGSSSGRHAQTAPLASRIRRSRRARCSVSPRAAQAGSLRTSEMSQQMRDVRKQMEENEQVSAPDMPTSRGSLIP